MNEDSFGFVFGFVFVLIVAAIAAVGGVWGARILYAIIPALILSPLASILYLKFDRIKIKQGAVLRQFETVAILAIVISIIIALGSFFLHSKYNYTTNTTVLIAFIVTLLLSGCASIFLTKHNIKEEIEEEKKAKIRNERELIKKQREKENKDEIERKYGVCGQKIANPRSLGNDYLVRVFFQTKTVILKRNDVFSFSDFIRSSIEKREEEGLTMETTTKSVSDNKSVIGRSIAGAFVAGATGAIIGGLTATRKEKEESKFVSCTIKKYKVLIYTKKQEVPIVAIDTDKDHALAENIKNTIDAIISMV